MTAMPHLDEEMLAGYLTGALEAAETAEVARHLEACDDCMERLVDVNSLLALLPETVDDLTPPPSVKTGLLGNIRAIEEPAPIRPAAPAPQVPRPRRWAIEMPVLALAASVLVALFLGAVAGGLIARSDDTAQGLLQAITGATQGIVLPMNGTEVAPDVRAALLAPDGVDRVYVVASNVPPPPAGHTYNLYLYENGSPIHAATLEPDAQGRISAVLNAPLSRFEAMELDIQPVGTTTPGGPAVLKSTLP